MIGKLRRTISAARRVATIYDRTSPALEPVYRDLFVRDLARAGIADEFYPVGSAANHGLMYVILRCLRECPVSRVLELGGGQTTLLLDRARAALGGAWTVRTIEHDPYWANDLGARCGHEVRAVSLTAARHGGERFRFYELGEVAAPEERFDLVIVDGPPGSPARNRFNRLGALALLQRHLAPEFVVVIDDAEREGEAALGAALRHWLRRQGATFHEGHVVAAKRQHVFCSQALRAAAYF